MPIHIQKHCRLKSGPTDGVRILTMRYWPRGCRQDQFDVWLPKLAPSTQLLAWVKKQYQLSNCDPLFIEESWRDKYIGEMEQQSGLITELREQHEHGKVMSLLCSCHDPNSCHRMVLRNLILRSGDQL